MKHTLLLLSFIIVSMTSSFSQMTCDSLDFYSDTVYINQSTDNLVTMNYYYDNSIIPVVFYSGYTITLNDTTNIVFREFLSTSNVASFMNFNITYKNPSIPNGTIVTGTFNIGAGLECSYPVVFIFNNPLGIESSKAKNNFNVFPNPTAGNVTIELNEPTGNYLIEVNNILGQTIEKGKFNNTTSINFNIDGPKGLYLVTIKRDNEQAIILKVLKE